jgi:bacterioferritin-associated ferredoxin
MPKRSFVCRCEDVTLHDIDHAVEAGLTTIEDIKRYTGLGTGPCQGKECMSAMSRILADRELVPAEKLQPFTARPPAEPVTFGALATVSDRLLIESAGGTYSEPEEAATKPED